MSLRPSALAWLAPSIVCAVAFGRAWTSPSPAEPPPASDPARRLAFTALASEEASMRATAAKDFPTDPWSADDDFHSLEKKRAYGYARDMKIRRADVLLAIDEGMRERWPPSPKLHLDPTVPPCRPRPIY